MKKVFAFIGSSNVGKTTTVRGIYDLLWEKLSTVREENLDTPKREIWVILTIGKFKVGIISAGDPKAAKDIKKYLELFRRKKCRFIVCACRSWGITTNAVRALGRDYTIQWETMPTALREKSARERDAATRNTAKRIVEEILNTK